MSNRVRSRWKDFLNWLIGLPKCKKGGRCNMDSEIEYTMKSGKFFRKSNRWSCSKCHTETTKYGEI
jgi:hypothetical protein